MRRAFHFWAPLALTADEKVGIDDAIEMEAKADRIVARAPSRFIVSADPDEVIEKIAPYVELGFNHLFSKVPATTKSASYAVSVTMSCRGSSRRSE